jgi:arylsulfatase A-like enzyme
LIGAPPLRPISLPPWSNLVNAKWITASIAATSVCLFATAVHAQDAPKQLPKKRPNIVLILADDLGYSDIGCYGSEIKTPNLDKLAAKGLRFTNFFNTARCCPSRAALLTGLYSHQAGVGHMTENSKQPGYEGQLNRNCVTIAEVLRRFAYRCYMIGKWHLSRPENTKKANETWPLGRGFDRYYGLLPGAANYFRPEGLARDNTLLETPTKDFYLTDAFADNAVQFITDHEKDHKSEPFFLYTAFTAPHWPLHALKEDIDRYRGKYHEGWDVLRQKRHERMKELGIVDPNWKVAKSDAPAWDKVPEAKKDELDLRMAIYAAQIDRMDQGIGRIVEALRKTGQLDNTVIFFLSDNGGCAEVIERGTGGELGGPDSFSSYGQGWAWMSNAILRLFKHWTHGGGVSSPFIVHWPDGIPASAHGQLRRQPGHLIDLMATCVDLAGAEYPRELDGRKITPLEGKSLVPAFKDQPIERDAIYWEHEGNKAVLAGSWKLVSKHPGPWELYDFSADRGEAHDLAAEQPERVKELADKWQAWAERANVLPLRPYEKAGDAKKSARTPNPKRSFDLKDGDKLTGDDAPDVGGRAFTIVAELGPKIGDGVLLAHGGTNHGYSLFIEKNHLVFGFRHAGKLSTVKAPAPMTAGPGTVTASLAKDGSVLVLWKDEKVAEGKVAGPLRATPQEGMQVGQDFGAAVGNYTAPFRYGGDIRRVVLTLSE